MTDNMSVTDNTAELTPLTHENGVPPANGMPGEGEANDANNGGEKTKVRGGHRMEARHAGDGGTIGTILTAARFLLGSILGTV
jgi:hypothetical protein